MLCYCDIYRETDGGKDILTDGHFHSIRDFRGRYSAKYKEILKCLKRKIGWCDDICLRSSQKPENAVNCV